MKKIAIGVIVIALFVVTALIIRGQEDTWICENGEWVKHGNPSFSAPESGCGDEAKSINSFTECIEAGYPVLESYPRQCKTPRGQTFTEDVGNGIEKEDLIKVSSPRPGQTISSPFTIKGEARGKWFFEASFPFKLVDSNNKLIKQDIIQAKTDWMTENFVPFETEVRFEAPETKTGYLVLMKDNPSGLPENDDELRIPVTFGEITNEETMSVKAFFNNSNLDPEYSCNKVFSVTRKVPKSQAVARAALTELLKGPTQEEKTDGFFTSINSDVEIQSLTIENDVAKVDFSDKIEYQVGGSCRVSAIRAQIIETLKQFPTVKQVVISVNGRTEDILQP